eukprot:XP_020404239.1 uncharacterized protein LOC103647952 [Zea mays]
MSACALHRHRRLGQDRISVICALCVVRLRPASSPPSRRLQICAVAAVAVSAQVAAIAGRVAVVLIICIRATAAVHLGFRAQELRQLVQVELLSAAAPLVCLVSLISIEFNMATNAIVVNITLDGQNYPEWAFYVETALRGHGLLFHLTDVAPVLADDRRNAADIKTWQLNDGKVMAAMVNSVKPSMIMSLSKFKTAKAIWSHLKERFVQDSGALLHTLMQQTHVIEQNDMSIDEYYSAFDRLMSALTSMVPACTADPCPAHKFIGKFFTYRFVMGVRAEFDSLCARLLQGSDTHNG